MHLPGVKLTISRSQVRRHNHYTTEPPINPLTPEMFPSLLLIATARRVLLHVHVVFLHVVLTDYSVDGYGGSTLGYVGPAGGQIMYIR